MTLLPRNTRDTPGDAIADRHVLRKLVGGGRLELLHAQLQALGFGIDRQDDRANDLSDLHDFARILDALLAREFRNVDQAVDALFDFHECAELGESRDLAFDDFPDRDSDP